MRLCMGCCSCLTLQRIHTNRCYNLQNSNSNTEQGFPFHFACLLTGSLILCWWNWATCDVFWCCWVCVQPEVTTHYVSCNAESSEASLPFQAELPCAAADPMWATSVQHFWKSDADCLKLGAPNLQKMLLITYFAGGCSLKPPWDRVTVIEVPSTLASNFKMNDNKRSAWSKDMQSMGSPPAAYLYVAMCYKYI